ncbi:MAG: hypothetical protein M1821_004532 [Bathelium mastoideum]|nr:MAG: hypothetical protein M1821_004532 [Bathelium mastoideum]
MQGCLLKRDGTTLNGRQLCQVPPTPTSTSAPDDTLTASVTQSLLSTMMTMAVSSSASTLLSGTSNSTSISSSQSATPIPSLDPSQNPGADGRHSGNGSGGSRTNAVAIAGGVGAAGAIAVFSLLILFCLRRQRRRGRDNDTAGAVEKGPGLERRWNKLGSRMRVNVQGLQSRAGMAGAALVAALPARLRGGNDRPNGNIERRNGSAGSNYPTGTATPEPNFINGPQSSTIRFSPFATWKQKLGENGNSPKPSPQPYPFLINNPLGEPRVASNPSSAPTSNPFADQPEPIYLRITNPDPGTPGSNGTTPRPKYLTAGPFLTPRGSGEPTAYPFPRSSSEDPFVDPPPNATIKDVNEVPPSLLPAVFIPRKPISNTAITTTDLQPIQENENRARNQTSPPPDVSPVDFDSSIPEPPMAPDPSSSIPYTIPANATFDPSSTIYFVPSSHNSITPIASPPTPDSNFIHRSVSKDTKARSDPFDLDRPEIWASLRTANARARGSETTDAATTERSAGSIAVNWEEREKESRMARDRWSKANPGRESPTVGIGL